MYSKPILTAEEYQAIKAKYEKYHEMRKQVCKSPNCVDQDEQKILSPWHVKNEQISQLEVYEFIYNIPHKYFAYVTLKGGGYITTWTGENLGEITYYNRYRNNMGDERAAIRVTAINGKKYYGTFYKSAGDYCRLTMCKD